MNSFDAFGYAMAFFVTSATVLILAAGLKDIFGKKEGK